MADLVQIRKPGGSDPVWVCMRTLAVCISVSFSLFLSHSFSLFGDNGINGDDIMCTCSFLINFVR